jgi:hypothetical protein
MICCCAATELRGPWGVTGWARIRGTEIMQGKQFIRTIGLAVAGFVAGAGVAHAQVTEADVGVNPTFEQTGATTITASGGFFSAVRSSTV